LAEVIAWCTDRPPELTPGDGLWTPSLRPAGFRERPPYAEIEASYRLRSRLPGAYFTRGEDLWERPVAERQGLVAQVAAARAEALRRQGGYPSEPAFDLGQGRLVLFAPDETLSDGAADFGTHGFFDVENIPAWDTWLWYAEDAERTAAYHRWLAEGRPRTSGPPGFASYLVSWVPSHLIGLVDYGLQVNPEGCLAWANDVDTALTRELRDWGLL
jgi:hypothetical protein